MSFVYLVIAELQNYHTCTRFREKKCTFDNNVHTALPGVQLFPGPTISDLRYSPDSRLIEGASRDLVDLAFI